MRRKLNRQLSEADCGPACISTILMLYGKKVFIGRIRKVSNTNLYGTTVQNLIKCLDYFGIDSKPFKIKSQNDFSKIRNYPCILMKNINGQNHYVIKYPKTKNEEIYIGDPIGKIEKVSFEIFSQNFNNIIIVCKPNEKLFSVKNDISFLSFLTQIANRKKKKLLIISLLAMVISFLGLAYSYFFQFVLDKVIPEKDVNYLVIISFITVGCVVFKALLDYIRQILIVGLSCDNDIELNDTIVRKVLKLPAAFYDSYRSGEIISRINDLNSIREITITLFVTLFLDGILLLISGCIVLYRNLYIFLIAVLEMILNMLILSFFRKSIQQENENLMELKGLYNSFLIEVVQGFESIKTKNLYEWSYKKLHTKYTEYIGDSFKLSTKISFELLIIEAMKTVFNIITIFCATLFVFNNQLSIGEVFALNMLVSFMLVPITDFSQLFEKYNNSKIAFERVEEIMMAEPELKGGERNVTDTVENIEIENLFFSYHGSTKKVLKNINLEIEPSEKIAIVGETGSGKSTLIKLLLRLYNPLSGEIRLNGINISKFEMNEFRNQIGYVSQTPFLFNGTIKENITIGGIFSEEKINEICESVGIDEFIKKLPNGINTIVQENGKSLSGGQRQRICIAQALIKNPKILILDEATSNLDAFSEKKVFDAIAKLDNTIVIMVTHRLSSTRSFDRIVLMNDGEIMSVGTHNYLYSNVPMYKKMWDLQQH